MVKYKKEDLERAVSNSYCWADVCRTLGLKPATGSQAHIKSRCEYFGIDSSHFNGKNWNKGKSYGYKKPISTYLSNSVQITSSRLLHRLVSEGIKEYRCEMCGLEEWLGEKAPLELDHINGNHYDNTLDNLSVLCPNCHTIKHRRLWRNRKTRQA